MKFHMATDTNAIKTNKDINPVYLHPTGDQYPWLQFYILYG